MVLTMYDVVGDKELCMLFHNFLSSTHAAEGLDFWVEVELMKRASNRNPEEGDNIRRDIFEKYFTAGSEYELNIDAKVRRHIQAAIDPNYVPNARPVPSPFASSLSSYSPSSSSSSYSPSTSPSSSAHIHLSSSPPSSSSQLLPASREEAINEVFSEAQNHVLLMLQHDALPKFLTTSAYQASLKKSSSLENIFKVCYVAPAEEDSPPRPALMCNYFKALEEDKPNFLSRLFAPSSPPKSYEMTIRTPAKPVPKLIAQSLPRSPSNNDRSRLVNSYPSDGSNNLSVREISV